MQNEKDLLEYEIECLKGDLVLKRQELDVERAKTRRIAEQCLEYVRQISVVTFEREPPRLDIVEYRIKELDQLLAKLI